MQIKIELVDGGKMPTKGDPEAAGYDLYSNAGHDFTLGPGDIAVVDVGIKTEMPIGWRGRICDKSGLASKHGIHTMAGLIDSNYRDEWKVVLINHSPCASFVVKNGTKIAQVCFEKVDDIKVVQVEQISNERDRGGGFGHYGLM